MEIHPLSLVNTTKYDNICNDYDHLDKESENKIHCNIRKEVCQGLFGNIIEIGVGTGNNIPYYPNNIKSYTGVDVSIKMLEFIKNKYNFKLSTKTTQFQFPISLRQGDIGLLKGEKDNSYNWYIATYVFCVLPQEIIKMGITQMIRVLKNAGRFKIVDIVISKNKEIRRQQIQDSQKLKNLYSLNLYNNTLGIIQNIKFKNTQIKIKLTTIKYLYNDTFLLIEGIIFK